MFQTTNQMGLQTNLWLEHHFLTHWIPHVRGKSNDDSFELHIASAEGGKHLV